MPIGVIRHEARHASFEGNRVKGLADSIFNAQYYSFSEKPLSKTSNLYAKYMSAEELYNWAHDPYWISDRFKNIATYDSKFVIDDLNSSLTSLSGSIELAHQTELLAHEFYTVVDKMRKNWDHSILSIAGADGTFNVVGPTKEMTHLLFQSDKLKGLSIHIPKRLREKTKHLLMYNHFVMRNADSLRQTLKLDSLEDIPAEILRDIHVQARKQFKEELKQDIDSVIDEVFEYVSKQQLKLNRISKEVIETSADVQKYTKEFVKQFKEDRKHISAEQLLMSGKWQEKFKELREVYLNYSKIFRK